MIASSEAVAPWTMARTLAKGTFPPEGSRRATVTRNVDPSPLKTRR